MSRNESAAATVIEGLLKRLYELNADDHPAEEAARMYLAQQGTDAKELPAPEEVRGILPKPPPGGWDAPSAAPCRAIRLRLRLLLPWSCRWNAWVRDVTARWEAR